MNQEKIDPWWQGKNFSYFQNTRCEFFPCHKGVDVNTFSCLFCYCPLYVLGKYCGGQYTYLKNDIKDCSHCTLPHQQDSYGYITERFQEIIDIMK